MAVWPSNVLHLYTTNYFWIPVLPWRLEYICLFDFIFYIFCFIWFLVVFQVSDDEVIVSECDLQDLSIIPLLNALHAHKTFAMLDLSHNLLGILLLLHVA